jgi:hypothetical protein
VADIAACRKANDMGYPHELWTTRLLARHVRDHAVAAGHSGLASVVQGTVCKILDRYEPNTPVLSEIARYVPAAPGRLFRSRSRLRAAVLP